MVKPKAHRVKRHMERWGIIHLIWSCVAFYAATQYFFQWERPYDEAILGFAVFWFLVKFLANEYANHKTKK
jgi:polyferredoxin